MAVRGSNPREGKIFHIRAHRPWGPPVLYNGYQDIPGVKRTGRGVNHPTPSTAEVKERVQLYIYCPSGPSWQVVGRTSPFTFVTYVVLNNSTANETSPIQIQYVTPSDTTGFITNTVITYFMCISCMHESDMSRIITTFIKTERTTHIYKQEKSLMFRKNNNPYFQETLNIRLLIPAFFGTSNVHLHTRPVNKLVMATAYSNTTARSHS